MTANRDRIASETAFGTPCATTTSSWHLTNRRCRRAELAVRFSDSQSYFASGFGLPPAEARDEGWQSLRHAMA
jgi:hypothetical protein